MKTHQRNMRCSIPKDANVITGSYTLIENKTEYERNTMQNQFPTLNISRLGSFDRYSVLQRETGLRVFPHFCRRGSRAPTRHFIREKLLANYPNNITPEMYSHYRQSNVNNNRCNFRHRPAISGNKTRDTVLRHYAKIASTSFPIKIPHSRHEFQNVRQKLQ